MYLAIARKTCTGFSKRTGMRCGNWKGLVDGRCIHHVNQCQGRTLDGDKCFSNYAKPGYRYCRAAHNPELPYQYISPSLFGQDRLRYAKLSEIVELYNGEDAYLEAELPDSIGQDHQLDHKLEKQTFAHTVLLTQGDFDDDEERNQMVAFFRDEVANEDENLAVTRTHVNQMKGHAVTKFHDDLLTGHRENGDGKTLVSYLYNEMKDGERLQRATTELISKEMRKAFKFSIRKLNNEGETRIFDVLARKMQEISIDMDLK